MLATLGLAILLPAAIAAGVFLAIRRFCLAEIAQRYAGPIALAAGFVLAYRGVMIGALGAPAVPWVPSRAWHWLPYLALAAAVVGPIAANRGLVRLERWLLEALVCCLTAALLVPQWATLYPPRWLSIPLLAVYLLALIRLLEPLSLRVPGARLLTAFTISAVGVSLLIAAFVSLTYATMAASAAAALAGCCAAALLDRSVRSRSEHERQGVARSEHGGDGRGSEGNGGEEIGSEECEASPPMPRPSHPCSKRATLQGLSLPFAVLIGGWSYTACIDPRPPLPGLLLAAAAPAALWWRTLRPSAPRQGLAAWLIDAGAVASIVTLAALLMI